MDNLVLSPALIIGIVAALAVILFFVLRKKPENKKTVIEHKEITPVAPKPEVVAIPKISWKERIV